MIKQDYPSWLDINAVLEKYKTKGSRLEYVDYLCLPYFSEEGDTEYRYTEDPVAVFWQENPKKGHSNYFGFFRLSTGGVGICNALNIDKVTWSGLRNKLTDETIISKYRHDFRYDSTRTFFVDGGLDYFRVGGDLSNAVQVACKLKDYLFVAQLSEEIVQND